ncbi:MAG TPA: hypothetical protein VNB90_14790 [Cytophagaceae bacterium]|jgi:hypothetical protein|nr:hypothetical protein [Cytophagaceae bacterium]
MKTLGITLIVLGLIAMIYTGFTYTTKEKVVDLGPIDINKEKKHTVYWPPVAGLVLLIAGGLVMIVDKKK